MPGCKTVPSAGSSSASSTSEASTSKAAEYLTLKLTADQIERYWDALAPDILRAMEPETGASPKLRTLLLHALLRNEMQAWMVYRVQDGERRRMALATTRVKFDPATETRNLVVVSLYGYERMEEAGWRAGLSTLKEYAKGAGCDKVVAYADSDRVMELVDMLGGERGYTLVLWEV